MVPSEIWMLFVFSLGASIGSFLNVVIYRLPLDMSLVYPASRCSSCEHPIAWYDNIPIFSWFILRGKCRHCKGSFSIRYAIFELLTGVMFVALYWLYFHANIREGMLPFQQGGFILYAGHVILLCVLLSSSMIDAEHWIIPLRLSYTMALVGVVLSMFWPYYFTATIEKSIQIIPYASPKTGALALGATVGLIISILLVKKGVLKRSFLELDLAWEKAKKEMEEKGEKTEEIIDITPEDVNLSVRKEMLWEIAFLLPPLVLALICMAVLTDESALAARWQGIIVQQKWLAGLLGSLFGFMIGGITVWATRIFGSLAFGKEAMGLGDVHLMAGVGAVLGWFNPLFAFFVAPFFGLGWAILKLVLHRRHEIPYGPFLSMAVVLVMVAQDQILAFLQWWLNPPM